MKLKYKNYKKKMKLSLWITAILLVSLLEGCGNSNSNNNNGSIINNSSSNPTNTPNNVATAAGSSLPPYQFSENKFTPNANNNNQSNGTNPIKNSKGHTGPASLYPNPGLTPGDVFPGATAAQVCVPGYSKSVRNVSSEEKAAVMTIIVPTTFQPRVIYSSIKPRSKSFWSFSILFPFADITTFVGLGIVQKGRFQLYSFKLNYAQECKADLNDALACL